MLKSFHNYEIFKVLINPIGIENFFENYFEKRLLYIQNRTQNYYNDILTVEDIDEVFQLKAIPPQSVKVAKDGQYHSFDSWTDIKPEKQIALNSFKITNTLKQGGSIVLNYLHNYLPKLQHFIFQLQTELVAQMWANVYITPPSSKAFKRHYDTHDVFVLQLKGTKNWRIFNSPFFLPDDFQRGEKIGIDFEQEAVLSREILLKQGDLLYIPRGLIHEASTTDTTSIHITLGMSMPMLKHLYKQLERDAIENAFFRKSIRGFQNEIKNPELIEQRIKKELINQIEKLEIEDFIQQTYFSFIKKKLNTSDLRTVSSIIQSNTINEQTLIQPRKDLIFYFSIKDFYIVIQFNSREEKFPIPFKDALMNIFSGEPLYLKDIKGLSTSQQKIILVKDLYHKKMIDIV